MRVVTPCPVCGGTLQYDIMTCPHCHFPYAGATQFGSPGTFKKWQQLVKQAIADRRPQFKGSRADQPTFSIGPKQVAYVDVDGKQTIINAMPRRATVYEDLKQVLFTNRYTVLLHHNGTITIDGNVSDIEAAAQKLINITFVAEGNSCLYAVDASGHVHCCGYGRRYQDLSRLTDVRMVTEMRGVCLLVLHNDGHVETIGAQQFDPQIRSIRNAVCVVSADHNGAILCDDGHVIVLSDSQVLKAAEQWRDIVDIAMDSRYIIGLNSKGDVLMAGEAPDFIDQGRRQAASWKNMVAIASTSSGFGGIDQNGQLYLAGNISYIDQLKAIWTAEMLGGRTHG